MAELKGQLYFFTRFFFSGFVLWQNVKLPGVVLLVVLAILEIDISLSEVIAKSPGHNGDNGAKYPAPDDHGLVDVIPTVRRVAHMMRPTELFLRQNAPKIKNYALNEHGPVVAVKSPGISESAVNLAQIRAQRAQLFGVIRLLRHWFQYLKLTASA